MTQEIPFAGALNAQIDAALLDSLLANTAFALLDHDQHFVRISRKFALYLGLPTDTQDGHMLQEASPGLAAVLELPLRLVLDENQTVLDINYATSTDSIRMGAGKHFLVSCYPVDDPQQEGLRGALVIVSDVPEHRQGIAGRRLVDRTLRESRQRLDSILGSLDEVVWSVSTTTFDVLYLNPAAETIYGRPTSEFFHNSRLWLDVVHPDDQEQAAAYRRALLEQDAAEMEYRIVRPNGEVRCLRERARLIYDPESGAPLRIDGIATDITERKQAQKALQEREELLSQLLENFPNGSVSVFDRDMRYVLAQGKGLAQAGLSPEMLEGKTLFELFTHEAAQYAASHYERTFRTGQTITIELEVSGKVYQLVSAPLHDREGEVTSIVVVAQDITKSKQVEQSLREVERRLRTVLSNLPVIVYSLDKDGIVTFSEGKGLESLGLLPGQTVGQSVFEMYRNHPEVLQNTRRALQGDVHPRLVEVNGILLQTYYTPIRDQISGAVVELIAVTIDVTEQLKAQEELRRQKEILQTIFDNVPVMISFVDSERRYKTVNREWERVLGWTLEEAQNVDLLALSYPDPQCHQHVQDSIREANSHWEEFQTRVKDGRIIDTAWANVRLSNGWNIGIGQDVTERRQAKQALKESEGLFRSSFDNASIGMALVGLEGGFLRVNEALCRFLGYPPEELLNLDFQSLTHLEDLQADLSYVADLLEGRRRTYRMEKRYIHKDGHVLWGDLSVSLMREGNGKPRYFIAQVQDITARKEAEATLQESEHLLRRVTDDAPVYLAYCDREHRYRFVNRGYAERFGLSPEDVVGKHITEIVGEGAYNKMLPQVEQVLSGTLVHFEAWMPYASIGNRYMAVDYVPDRDEHGQVQALVAVILDITARKEAEEALAQSREQLRALAVRLEESIEEERKRISREIHDQLGQALTGFKLDVAWMERHLPAPGALAESASLEAKLEAMSEVVDGLIDSVRALSWELRPPALDDLGLEAAIEWQVEEFQKRSGIQTNFTTEPLEPEPDSDRATAAFRILQEALTNVARHAEATRVDIFLSVEEGNLLLEVRDNGRGMPQEAEERLAGGDAPGKSLGLVGMRERARAFGGMLQIRSRPGKGTTLLLQLPMN